MVFTIGDGARALINSRHINATDKEIIDCCENPDKTGNAFDRKCFAKQFGEKVVCVIVHNKDIILEVLSVVADLSQYDSAGDFYQVQLSAGGDKAFYKVGKGFTAIGNIQKDKQ